MKDRKINAKENKKNHCLAKREEKWIKLSKYEFPCEWITE